MGDVAEKLKFEIKAQKMDISDNSRVSVLVLKTALIYKTKFAYYDTFHIYFF